MVTWHIDSLLRSWYNVRAPPSGGKCWVPPSTPLAPCGNGKATTYRTPLAPPGRRRRAHVVAAAASRQRSADVSPATSGGQSGTRRKADVVPQGRRLTSCVRVSLFFRPALQGRAAGADNRSVHSAHSKRAEHRERNMHTIAIINARGGRRENHARPSPRRCGHTAGPQRRGAGP